MSYDSGNPQSIEWFLKNLQGSLDAWNAEHRDYGDEHHGEPAEGIRVYPEPTGTVYALVRADVWQRAKELLVEVYHALPRLYGGEPNDVREHVGALLAGLGIEHDAP